MEQEKSQIKSSVCTTGFDKADKKIANRYVRFGYLIIILFCGSIVSWSAFAKISSAAIAAGLVGKDGYRKTVQHLEGGIIQKILVRDGDKVRENQELIELEDIQSRSDFELLHKQKLIASTREACLIAESKDQDDVALVLPDGIELDNLDGSVRGAIEGHIEAFYVRRKLHKEQIDIIDQRIRQSEEKIKALKKELEALNKKGSIISQEQKKYQEFEKKGLVTRAQVFTLKRDKASNEADITANQVAIESTRQEINNLKMEKSELIANNTKRIVSDLDNVRDQLVDMDEKLAKTEDRLDRTVIRAPIDGVIVDLRVNTIGGVVRPGDPLLDIVPEEGNLIIEAQVDPKDRDTVSVGQNAEVRFTAFNQRITEPVPGKVIFISADRLVDKSVDGNTQLAYYKAKVELLEDPSEVLNGAPIYPGMQADVMIITGERTALEYFLNPVVKSFNRAFRDD